MKLTDFRNVTAFRLKDSDDNPIKNLTFDRDPPARVLDFDLDKTVRAVHPPIGLAMTSSGIEPLFDGNETLEDMTNDKGSALRHRKYSRLLPAHVIKDELAKWSAEFDEQQGRRPSNLEERDKRLSLEAELTPKAFIKHQDTFILRSYETLIVTTATESLSDTIRADFFDLPEQEVRFKPFFEPGLLIGLFDTWAKGQGLNGFEVDPEGSFQLARERDGAKVSGKGTDVSDKRFTDLLGQGYRVTRLPLIQIDSEATFQIDTSGRIRGLNFPQFTAVLNDQMGEDETQITEDRATLAIMRSMILALLQDLKDEIDGNADAEELV